MTKRYNRIGIRKKYVIDSIYTTYILQLQRLKNANKTKPQSSRVETAKKSPEKKICKQEERYTSALSQTKDIAH